MKPTVNLLLIATNKYTRFLKPLIDSCEKYFLKDCRVNYFVFTDRMSEVSQLISLPPGENSINICNVEHKPWPYATLHRFTFFRQYIDMLQKADYSFYMDVDCLVTSPINSDILSERTAVQHCGYVEERGTYEERKESCAYVGPNEGTVYYGGGFWGFSTAEFKVFLDKCIDMLNKDHANGIVPVWHDESILNRYLIDNPPIKTLTPSYHYPENHDHIYGKWKAKGKLYSCKILLLSKNHEELRS